MKKIAIIGAGNMGSAIAASLPAGEYDVTCTAHTSATLDRLHSELPGAHLTLSNPEAVRDADIVVIAVKPYMVAEIAEQIAPCIRPGAMLISVVAALSVADLGRLFLSAKNNLKILRVIPNTAIRYGKSATFISAAADVDDAELRQAVDIFNLSGKAFVISEKDMAACTALASCGIAYFLRFIRAAVEGCVELGLRPAFATEIAALTAEGAASLLLNGSSHPEAEIDKVTTPGGITIKGLNALEAHGLTAAVIAALRASV